MKKWVKFDVLFFHCSHLIHVRLLDNDCDIGELCASIQVAKCIRISVNKLSLIPIIDEQMFAF